MSRCLTTPTRSELQRVAREAPSAVGRTPRAFDAGKGPFPAPPMRLWRLGRSEPPWPADRPRSPEIARVDSPFHQPDRYAGCMLWRSAPTARRPAASCAVPPDPGACRTRRPVVGARDQARRLSGSSSAVTATGSGCSPGAVTTGPSRAPRIVEAMQSLRVRSVTIDGEAVVCAPSGVTDFDRLRWRPGARRKPSCTPSTSWIWMARTCDPGPGRPAARP